MKSLAVQTALLLLSITSPGQTQLLKDYDFNKGGFYLLGMWVDSPNELQDTMGEFYTDDITILNQFKKEWTFKEPAITWQECGYHYNDLFVSVCKDGLILEHFSINLYCNKIESNKGDFYFDPQKIRMFKGKLKNLYYKSVYFTTLTEAREYRTKILSDSTLIAMAPTPEWAKYEGKFQFTYKCKAGTKTCAEKVDSLLQVMKAEIWKQYPGEEFEFRYTGVISATEIIVEVSCNKTLEEKFKLYHRDLEWESYRLVLVTYWTHPPK